MRGQLLDHTPGADITLLHDPELLAIVGAVDGPVVFDVHEDLTAQLDDKPWIPWMLRPLARIASRTLIRHSQKIPQLIAEETYLDTHRSATLVRNTPRLPTEVPPPMPGRAVYVGRVSHGRGAAVLAAASRRLASLEVPIAVDIMGPMDAGISNLFDGVPTDGFVRNDIALQRIQGATAGLALLQDLPNYRHSLPTKLLEYLAAGIPIITTPLPFAREIIERYDCGIVVPFNDADAVIEAVASLDADHQTRIQMGERGRAGIASDFNWTTDAAIFIAALESHRRCR
jgi:glycosyltransferase involved in cell wall biosynthesis